MTKCPCCGHQFSDAQGRIACSGCVARNGCGLLRCPDCGYESAREPGTLAFFRQLTHAIRWRLRGRPKADAESCLPSMPLGDLRKGETATVERFADMGSIRKFLSLGILPGTTVTVLRASPAVVVRVGYSEFAFDRALASTVVVRRQSDRRLR